MTVGLAIFYIKDPSTILKGKYDTLASLEIKNLCSPKGTVRDSKPKPQTRRKSLRIACLVKDGRPTYTNNA